MNKKATIINGVLSVPETDFSLNISSVDWMKWLEKNNNFRYSDKSGSYSARKEKRGENNYWYAYRRINGKLVKRYIGQSETLTQQRLASVITLFSEENKKRELSTGNSVKRLKKTHIIQNGEKGSQFDLSKFTPPPLSPKLVTRPRLLQKFSTQVIVVSAATGFGKTTLLTDWYNTCGKQVAWLNLTTEDNDLIRFWQGIIASLQTISPHIAEGWSEQLENSEKRQLEDLKTTIFNDLFKIREKQNNYFWIGLVIENFHCITNEHIIASFMEFLNSLPQVLKIVISSRKHFPLSFGFLRANGRITEIGTDDLQFTQEEGIAYLDQYRQKIMLSYVDMRRIVYHCEGWAAGLLLTGTALLHADDYSFFMTSFSRPHPFFIEYFRERVICLLPEDVRTFLMKVSILDSLQPDLCDSILEIDNSGVLLEYLRQEKLFIYYDKIRQTYSQHRLFRESLLNELYIQYPDELTVLHSRAAKWYLGHNLLKDAIIHFLAAEEWGASAALISENAANFLSSGYSPSVILQWMELLPDEVIARHEEISVLYTRLLGLILSPVEAKLHLFQFEDAIWKLDKKQHSATLQMLGEDVQFVRKILSNNDSEIINQDVNDIKPTIDILNGLIRYRHYARKKTNDIELMLNNIFDLSKSSENNYGMAMSAYYLAMCNISKGLLNQAEQILQATLNLLVKPGDSFPAETFHLVLLLAHINYLHGQKKQAEDLYYQAVDLNQDSSDSEKLVLQALVESNIQVMNGNIKGAVTTVENARRIHLQQPSALWNNQDLAAMEAQLQLRNGEISIAERLLNESGNPETNLYAGIARAEYLLSQKRYVACENILRLMIHKYSDGFLLLPVIHARIMLSIAFWGQNKINKSKLVMLKTCRLAAPEHFVQPFLEDGAEIPLLLSMVLHTENLDSGTSSFIKNLLKRFSIEKKDGEEDTHGIFQPLVIAASISQREQQILQMVCSGLSNNEIAEKCSVSISTVKTHLAHIFRKLNVNSRTKAIAQARALNLD